MTDQVECSGLDVRPAEVSYEGEEGNHAAIGCAVDVRVTFHIHIYTCK